ncbi:phosphodiester glycosidase family protein [Phormidium sp. FACHB-592]|uniref:Phosphodiester glycosidase family protein n=1 Tax=Stenomitos frigidus AS-A4 TaxID=2933935 RepID=A0ABV0KV03_9CYAN|nr:phosphodiester glycosidase family protein [Phormidium sp. FACHB-592]
MINGSFFDGTYAKAKHAGWLWILGQNYALIKQDPQLTHIALYNTKNQQIQFVDYQNFTPSRSNEVIEFQSGPIVVENSQVAKPYIAKSLNGSAPYTRSLLAVTDNRTKYFITVRKPIRLDDLANYLLSLEIFAGKRLDVLNLDGGPSVALYSRELINLRYNDTAQLPILLGAR